MTTAPTTMTTASPTMEVSARDARKIASGLKAWCHRTLRELAALDDSLTRQALHVATIHRPRCVETSGLDGVSGGLIAVLPPPSPDDRNAAQELGAMVLASRAVRQVAPHLRPILADLADELAIEDARLIAEAISRGLEVREWCRASRFEEQLASVIGMLAAPRGTPDTEATGLAFALGLPTPTGAPASLTAHDAIALRGVTALATDAQRIRDQHVEIVTAKYDLLVDQRVTKKLSELSLDTLRQAMPHGVRLSALTAAKIEHVADVWRHRDRLRSIPGIGEDSAKEIYLAASRLRNAVIADHTTRLIRFDLNPDDTVLTELLRSLIAIRDLDEKLAPARPFVGEVVEALAPWRPGLPKSDVTLLHRDSPRRAVDASRHLQALAEDARTLGLAQIGTATLSANDVWATFRSESAALYTLLGELAGVAPDIESVQGFISHEIAERVNAQPLRTDYLTSSLRGYQAFGAKFALVQRKVILGDEMGLGKTVQALAVMAHVAEGGGTHFLVVCPTGVLINWVRETRRHSKLVPFTLHGADRNDQFRRWRARGGVAITTYGTLNNLDFPAETKLDVFVADEAHQLKNPDTQRSRAARRMIAASERSLLLTGTPIENDLQEFRNLVGYLQPRVAEALSDVEVLIGAERFRQLSSPAYLRRRSDDVLTELPDLVIADDWVDLTAIEDEAYLEALADHQFQLMRRVAFVSDSVTESSKITRVVSLVDEAVGSGKKVLVFSYFRDVLDRLAEALGDRVVGTITGSLSAQRRQDLAEALESSATPAVLLSQIAAGGQGMNLQAASVVILCEPQVKPSLEDQAIKRAHRMGQVEKVVVHRVLTPDSVDERLLEILDRKRILIQEYVDVSEVAEASPEAKDVSDQEIARRVLAAEAERRKAELRARHGRPSPEQPTSEPPITATNTVRSTAPTAPTTPARPKPKPAPKPGPGASAKPARKRRTPPRPDQGQRKVDVCGSCERPISILGHCGCS